MTAIQVPLSMAELDALTPESTFGSQLCEWAQAHGWLGFHLRAARTKHGWATPLEGDKGFPDWVFVKHVVPEDPSQDIVVFAELKAKGKYPEPDQRKWLEALGRVAQRSNGAIRVFTWRPADRDEAYEVLS